MDKMCISVAEMSERLGISRTTAYELVKRADFSPAFRIGTRTLISVPALEKWLETQTETV